MGFGHSWSAGTGWGARPRWGAVWVRPGCVLHPVPTGCTGPSCGDHRQLGKGGLPLRTCTHSGTASLPPCSHLWVFLGIAGLLRTRWRGQPQAGAVVQPEYVTPVDQLHCPPSPSPSFLQACTWGLLASPKGCKSPAFPTPLLGFCRPVQTGGSSTGSTGPCLRTLICCKHWSSEQGWCRLCCSQHNQLAVGNNPGTELNHGGQRRCFLPQRNLLLAG